mgnify:CR=1 FL=1
MHVDQAVDVIRESFKLILMLSGPILLAALMIGLFVSVLQAVTQVQEQTLSFVPKIMGMGIVAILVAPWMTMMIMEIATRMFSGG